MERIAIHNFYEFLFLFFSPIFWQFTKGFHENVPATKARAISTSITELLLYDAYNCRLLFLPFNFFSTVGRNDIYD
jgi:hypothetical protein